MSSPLDSRMRAIAREEAERLATPNTPVGTSDADRLTALEKEVAELRGDLKRAYARIDELSSTEPEDKPTARRTRKTAGTE